MALKRSAGLETVACWQADAQWTEREVRDQLDALFAHRVYFATASARDARDAVSLTMAEFSDTVRPGIERLSSLGHPDVRLHLPKHHAIASWAPRRDASCPSSPRRSRCRSTASASRCTPSAPARARRRSPHADLRQPHWDRSRRPTRASGDGRVGLAPSDLRLPGGRTPHDFLRSDAAGRQVEAERFETIRADATLEIAGSAHAQPPDDVIVEYDDRLPVGRAARKLERYDHFLAGWSLHMDRYGRRAQAVPLVVFVCRDRSRARECARRADSVLRACRAYAGEYPLDWEYPGRQRILFVAERDVHEGLLHGYGVPHLPPDVRVTAAHGDPRVGAATVEQREMLDVPQSGALGSTQSPAR
jgi:hypothetical protein